MFKKLLILLIIKTLAHYGVVNEELSFFKSYLSSSKQSCYVNGKLSTPMNVLLGDASRLHPWTLVIYYIREQFT